MNTSRRSRSENRPEILRILHTVERKEKPRLILLSGMPEDLVFRGIGFGRHQRHHALVMCRGDQSIESFTRLNLQGNALDLGETNDRGKLTMAVRQEDFYKRTRSGP